MNIKETWISWRPVKPCNEVYNVKFISRDATGLTIMFEKERDPAQTMEMKFSTFAGYRETNESYSFLALEGALLARENVHGETWQFFKVINSEYIASLSKMSGGIAEVIGLLHFAIFDVDSLIDVLAYSEPECVIRGPGHMLV